MNDRDIVQIFLFASFPTSRIMRVRVDTLCVIICVIVPRHGSMEFLIVCDLHVQNDEYDGAIEWAFVWMLCYQV